MTPPLIGITCGTSRHDPRASAEQDRLNSAYSRAVSAAGGIPIILPVLPEYDPALLERLDGLLLSGGADIDPSLYAELPLNETVEVDARRDVFEIPLAREALRRDMPILGICRGIQTLNVALGGSLWQDLPSQYSSTIKHRQTGGRSNRTHAVTVIDSTRLAGIIGAGTFRVNSLHHQALRDVAQELRVSATAPDGIVEGVELPGARFVIAVQYHPEELTGECVEARQLFEAFVEATMRT